MQLDSEDLVHRFAQDWPEQFERSRLLLIVDKLTDENEQLRAEIARLNAGQATPLLPPRPGDTSVFSASVPRPYVMPDDEARHG